MMLLERTFFKILLTLLLTCALNGRGSPVNVSSKLFEAVINLMNSLVSTNDFLSLTRVNL